MYRDGVSYRQRELGAGVSGGASDIAVLDRENRNQIVLSRLNWRHPDRPGRTASRGRGETGGFVGSNEGEIGSILATDSRTFVIVELDEDHAWAGGMGIGICILDKFANHAHRSVDEPTLDPEVIRQHDCGTDG